MDKLLWTSKSNIQNVYPNTGSLFPTTFQGADHSPTSGNNQTAFLGTSAGPETLPPTSQTAKAPVVSQQSASDDFEGMVGDLRRIFIGWLKKTELELARERALLEKSKADFEEEKAKARASLEEERRKDAERLKDERKRNDLEVQTQLRQVQVEREEARKRLDEERTKRRAEWEEEGRRLSIEKEKLRQQQESFAHEKKRIADHNAATEVMVELNVGGTSFQTARTTLAQQPDSFLAGMVSGRHSVDRDRSGRIFIDRDSEQFRSILNFLRNPSKPPTPRDCTESELLAAEANFYGIHFFPFPLVFAIGGHNGIEHLRAVEVLDAVNETWRSCRSMATERVYFGGASLNSRLFVFGGQNLEYKALCETEVYDCLRDEWLLGPELNIARRNCASASLDGRVYAIGGFDGTGLLSSVEAYDPRMKNWAEIAPLGTARSSASAAGVGGKIFVLGGSCGQRLNTVEVFEPKMNKWAVLGSPMTEARSAGACTALLNRIYAIGGTDNDQQIHSSVEMFDEGLWSYRSACQSARMDLGACTVGESSILAGGGQSIGGTVLNQTEFYFPELNQWQAAPAMLVPRYGHQHLSVAL
jgi:N-acetylneuraminic acid mutarotase